MIKEAKEGRGQIYLYVHISDENVHASCHYQSTLQTERGEALRRKKGLR